MVNLTSNEDASQVRVSLGITKNLGNYESLRIDASLTLAVSPEEDRDEAWKRAWAEVDEQLETRILEADNALNE